MRRVASRAPFSLQWRVLEHERTLFVRVAFNASSIGTGSKPRLFEFEPTMWVVTVAALHYPFEHFVVKRFVEVGLRFSMAT
jgi:hypothetical protein